MNTGKRQAVMGPPRVTVPPPRMLTLQEVHDQSPHSTQREGDAPRGGVPFRDHLSSVAEAKLAPGLPAPKECVLNTKIPPVSPGMGTELIPNKQELLLSLVGGINLWYFRRLALRWRFPSREEKGTR